MMNPYLSLRHHNTAGQLHSMGIVANVIAIVLVSVSISAGDNPPQRTNVSLPSYCGPASLTLLLMLNGVRTSLDEVVALSGKDPSGTSIAGLQHAARAKGFSDAQGVQAESLSSLVGLSKTAILLMNNKHNTKDNIGHFLVLAGCDGDKCLIVDPPKPPKWVDVQEFNKDFSGNALVLSSPATSWQKYAFFTGRFGKVAGTVLFFLAITAVCQWFYARARRAGQES